MIKHLLKKLLVLLISLFIVATITFFCMHIIPGDPFTDEEVLPKEILDAMYRHYHLDQPLMVQYGIYLKNLAVLDFGPSLKYQGRSVTSIIKDAFPVSLTLGMEALCLAIFFGVTLGSLAALKKGKFSDQGCRVLALIGISVPSFILATFLQYIFSMKLGVFPVARWGTFAHTVLPALALSALPMAFIARITRSTMLETLQQDYIVTAKSKGLSTFQIIRRHALRNALLPVISYIGPLASSILTGSFVIEKIFGMPGLGQWFVMSVMNRDYSLIMAITLFYSAFLMVGVYIVDILYCLIDPRIKLQHD
ncbi:MAG: ABC transporter permease [Rhabdochlamydiaceae bacterium]|jgi:oligopeptide transport system permease protein